uniref:Kringle domain-containing protein n=1 Tax=Strix occidentalis caurina TaxID=311401 RepID=A0A8D0EVF1_STROC
LPTGLDDCYEKASSKYRGRVNQAANGKTCLHWNSHILLDYPINAFMEDAVSYGIGEHNFCRNPDEDEKPWCYIVKNHKVEWDFCDVSPCSGTGKELEVWQHVGGPEQQVTPCYLTPPV